MVDIGIVLYKKGDAPGTLEAYWWHAISGHGTGKATGHPVEGFAGQYHIQYFDDNGNLDAECDLMIEQNGEMYHLTWMRAGKVTARGLGIEVSKGLVAGWQTITEPSAAKIRA